MNFARHFSHDTVVSGITRELCSLGVTASCQPRMIPRCPALSQQDLHGDIVILSSGLNSDGATSSALNQVILDVAVVHNATRQGECRTFKKSCISNTGSYKKQKYRDYAPRNDFIPLVADSVGRIGGHALEFFSRAAGALTAGSVGRGGPNLDSAWLVLNKLLPRFLAESLEATSFRMLHGATAGQRARTSESGPSQPPSSAPSQLGGMPLKPVNGPQGSHWFVPQLGGTPPQAGNGPLGSQWGQLFPVLLVPAASSSVQPV
jgi:hypothetical protein